MDLRVLVGDGLQQFAVRAVDQHARFTLRADVDVSCSVARDSAMSPAECFPCGQRSPIMNDFVGPFAIAGAELGCVWILVICGCARRGRRSGENPQRGSRDRSTKPAPIDYAPRRIFGTVSVHETPHGLVTTGSGPEFTARPVV